MVLYPPQITADLEHKTLYLDTNVFSTAFRVQDFTDFLTELRVSGCALVTIPSVVFEVTRGLKSLDEYNDRTKALKALIDYVEPIRWLNEVDEFSFVMAKLLDSSNSQYTDFLLSCCLYKYRLSPAVPHLLTTDLKSLPKSIFNRNAVITVDADSEIKNYGLFSLDNKKFDLAVAKMLV